MLIREEGAVERIVAGRLLPVEVLQAYVDSLAELDVGVTAADVADEFEVAESVAARALEMLCDQAA